MQVAQGLAHSTWHRVSEPASSSAACAGLGAAPAALQSLQRGPWRCWALGLVPSKGGPFLGQAGWQETTLPRGMLPIQQGLGVPAPSRDLQWGQPQPTPCLCFPLVV